MNKRRGILIGLIVSAMMLSRPLSAQSEEEIPLSVNEGTLVGIGGYNLQDDYLSPGKGDLDYTGWAVHILNERMKMLRRAGNNRVSRQQMFQVEFGSTTNPAETASEFAAFVDYSLGYHYHFRPAPNLKLLAGGAARGLLGFIYNTRNSNNPASAKCDIDLSLSGMALYNLKIKDYPITLRYQLSIPFAGVLFSPHYDQSYYEIFNLNNYDGVVKFTSFHNKFAMKNYLTVDFPVGNLTIRAGYRNSFYYTDVNNLQGHIVSHSFMIGIVKEFISFGGKQLKQKERYNSAYY